MGKQKTTSPFIPGFTCLGKSIYLQDPAFVSQTPYPQHQAFHPDNRQPQHVQNPPQLNFTASSNPLPLPSPSEATTHNTPDLILLTSWTGAQARHIAKYTLSYNQLYPGTPLLVITTTIADLALRRLETKLAALAPAVSYLAMARKSNILLHAFSEGGTHKAVCLARAYLAAHGKKLPVRAYLLDSSPGTPRYTSNVAAFKRSLPRNAVARALGLPIGASVLGVTWILFGVFVGYENNLISQTRRALNDERLWEDVRNAPRTYLFSERDDLIDWRDVERHGEETAEALGVRSLLVRFKESGHCGHARGNEGLYWGAVRRTWESRANADVETRDSGRPGDLVLTSVCCGERLRV